MLTFTLPSLVWPLPICLDSWTWHSRFLCNIALYSIGPCFYHQSHPQLVLFLLWLYPFILSGVISPLISSSILGTYRLGEFLFQNSIILPFHTVHGVLKARTLKWLAIPFSSGPHSVRPLHHGCILSPCLFNLYAEYIMRNAGLEEAQAGRLSGEISITSDLQMTPPLWQKVKRN